MRYLLYVYILSYTDIAMDDVPMDLLCVSDAGECMHQMFNKPSEYKGQRIGLCSDSMTIQGYADVLNKVFESDGRVFKAGTVSYHYQSITYHTRTRTHARTHTLARADTHTRHTHISG